MTTLSKFKNKKLEEQRNQFKYIDYDTFYPTPGDFLSSALDEQKKLILEELEKKIIGMETIVKVGKNVDGYPVENAYLKKTKVLKEIKEILK